MLITKKQLTTRVAQLKVSEVPICLKKKAPKEMLAVEWILLLISKETFFREGKVQKDQIRNQTEKSFSQQKSIKKLKTA